VGKESSVVGTEAQEAKVSVTPLKSCPAFHGEARETIALPGSNHLRVAAHAPEISQDQGSRG